MRSSRKSSVTDFLWTYWVVLDKELLSKKQDWASSWLAVSPMILMDATPAMLPTTTWPSIGEDPIGISELEVSFLKMMSGTSPFSS